VRENLLSGADTTTKSLASGNRVLTEKDAVEIWIARWLRIPRKVLLARFACDSARLYEVWWGERFPGSRARAAEEFRRRYPELADRTVFGYRRIPRTSPVELGRQPDLFG